MIVFGIVVGIVLGMVVGIVVGIVVGMVVGIVVGIGGEARLSELSLSFLCAEVEKGFIFS